MKYVWIDCETTGLEPHRHEVLSVGLIITDGNGEPIDDGREWLLPCDFVDADPKALEINGIDPSNHPRLDTIGGIDLFNARCLEIGDFLHAGTAGDEWLWAGWNPQFDLGFIAAIPQINLRLPGKRDHHTLDVWPVARTMFADAKHLSKVCKSLGVETYSHTALPDAKAALAVWRRLRQLCEGLRDA